MRRFLRLAAAAAGGAAATAAVFAAALALRAPDPAALADEPAERTALRLRDARALVAAGDAAGAEALLRDIAAARPLDADARLMLGIHLQDLAHDPFGAVSEYHAYLRLAPDSEKDALVRERLHACELEIARRFAPEDVSAAVSAPAEPDTAVLGRIRSLESALAAARGDLNAVREALAETTAERDRLKRDNAAKQNQLDALKGAGANVRPPSDDLVAKFATGSVPDVPDTAAEPVAIADFMTYEVRRGDTLWKIAQKAYHDGSRTAEIKAANPGLVGADGSVREGDILRIPR